MCNIFILCRKSNIHFYKKSSILNTLEAALRHLEKCNQSVNVIKLLHIDKSKIVLLLLIDIIQLL